MVNPRVNRRNAPASRPVVRLPRPNNSSTQAQAPSASGTNGNRDVPVERPPRPVVHLPRPPRQLGTARLGQLPGSNNNNDSVPPPPPGDFVIVDPGLEPELQNPSPNPNANVNGNNGNANNVRGVVEILDDGEDLEGQRLDLVPPPPADMGPPSTANPGNNNNDGDSDAISSLPTGSNRIRNQADIVVVAANGNDRQSAIPPSLPNGNNGMTTRSRKKRRKSFYELNN